METISAQALICLGAMFKLRINVRAIKQSRNRLRLLFENVLITERPMSTSVVPYKFEKAFGKPSRKPDDAFSYLASDKQYRKRKQHELLGVLNHKKIKNSEKQKRRPKPNPRTQKSINNPLKIN